MDLSYHSRHTATANRMRKRIRREGFTVSGHKVWDASEDAIVRSLYPDYAAMLKALPNRSYYSCRHRARGLGIAKGRPPFTAKELSLIRRLYPTADRSAVLVALPGRDWSGIAKVAIRHGIYRRPKAFKITGVPVIDQIRMRCRELNYTMPDLDKMIRGKGYFGKASWRKGHIHHRDIGRAIVALFGDLKADWR